jgi:hypothetical protein
VRPCGVPRERHQSASNSVSTTDDPSSRAPVETRSSEAVCRAPWENPPAFAFQIRFGPAFPRSPKKTPDHLAVIRPPTAARLTARCRLRARRLPTRVGTTLNRAFTRGGEERCCLFGRATAPSKGPSDTSLGATCRELPEQPVPVAWACSRRRRVNVTRLSRPEVPSTGGDRPSALSSDPAERCPRWPAGQPPHAFIEVREPSTRPLGRSLS